MDNIYHNQMRYKGKCGLLIAPYTKSELQAAAGINQLIMTYMSFHFVACFQQTRFINLI